MGEYLCDPVLGSHAVEIKQQIPSLPYADDRSTSQMKSNDYSKKNAEEIDERRIAALSLRETLNNTVSFIEARCTLINIHAEMCSSDHKCSSESNWFALTKKCETVSCSSQFAFTIEKEAKALALALEIVTYIESFE